MKKFSHKWLNFYFGLLSIFLSIIAFSDQSIECVKLYRQFEEVALAFSSNPHSEEHREAFKNFVRKLITFAEDNRNTLEDRIFISSNIVGFVSRLNPSFNNIVNLTAQGLDSSNDSTKLSSAKSILLNYSTALQGPQDPRLNKAFTVFMELLDSNSLGIHDKLIMIDFLEEFRDSFENRTLLPEIVGNVPESLSFLKMILKWRATGNANDIVEIDKYLGCNDLLH